MKITEKTSINHEQLFQSLASAYIVFGVDDPTFTIVEENEAHADVAMVKRENVIGKPLFEVFPDTSEEYEQTGTSQLLESIRKVIKTGKTDVMPRLKYDIKDSRGKFTTKYWSVSHHPVFDDGHKVTAVYQATEDITDRIFTEQKLDIAQAKLEQTLANSAIGTWYWDIVDGKVYADKNVANMFGLPEEDVKNGVSLNKFTNSIHENDRKRVTEEIKAALATKGLFESEYRTFNHENDLRWVIVRGKIEVDENGEPVSFPGVIVDITERKTAETNLVPYDGEYPVFRLT